jgi:hypothetical protein
MLAMRTAEPAVVDDDGVEEPSPHQSPAAPAGLQERRPYEVWQGVQRKELPRPVELITSGKENFNPLTAPRGFSWTTQKLGQLVSEAGVSAATVDKFLAFLHSKEFDVNDLATTSDAVDRVMLATTPLTAVHEATLLSGKIYYFNIIDIWAEVIAKHGLAAVRSTWIGLPAGVPRTEAWHSELWRDTERLFLDLKAAGAKLLFWDLMIDAFAACRMRNVSLNCIEMRPQIMLPDKHMPLYVISVVPKELDIDEVLHEVIVRPTLQLEAGRMFGQQLMAGTIHLIAGDYVGQRDISGAHSVRGVYPDLWTMTTQEDIDKVEKPLVMKDVTAARAAIEKALQLEMAGERGWKGAYKQVLDSVGLSKISPLWNLKIFSRFYFFRFGACGLHMLHLGNQKKHAQALLSMALPTKADRGLVNAYVRQLTSSTHQVFEVQRLPGIVTEKIEGEKKLRKLVCLNGAEMRTWAMIAPVVLSLLVLNKTIKQEQYDCLIAHVESDLLLAKAGHTAADFALAREKIHWWQKEAIRLLPNRSWCFPNLVGERALPLIASYSAPIRLMKTAPMERRHKILRNVVTRGNGKNMSKYLLMEVNRKAHEFEMIPLRGTPAPPPLAPMELVFVQQRNIVFHGEQSLALSVPSA